jgi:hypothetical protein
MGRWALIALLLVAAWWGWTRHDRWRARGHDEFVFRNRTGAVLEDVKVRVRGMRWTLPRLAADTTVVLRVRCEDDGPFELAWRLSGAPGVHTWQGGEFTHGPIRMRHRFELLREDGVVWSAVRLGAAPRPTRPKPEAPRRH